MIGLIGVEMEMGMKTMVFALRAKFIRRPGGHYEKANHATLKLGKYCSAENHNILQYIEQKN